MCRSAHIMGTDNCPQKIEEQKNNENAKVKFKQIKNKEMESLKTQYPPNIAEPRAFEVHSAKDEKRRKTPSTPQRQGRPNSTGKLLELTPLWDQVQRYNRLPQNVETAKVFSELAIRLNDPEWEVRQHALRVLVDLLPVVANANNDLDELMIPVVLSEVTKNLGHLSPSIRKCATEVLNIYVKRSSDPEFVLRSIVSQGLESPAANSNLTMSVINYVPSLLKNTVSVNEISSHTISHQSLVHIVTALSKKLIQTTYQKQAVKSLVLIRDFVGESRFDHLLESYYPQVKRDFDVLCKVYEIKIGNSNIGDSGIDLQANSIGNSPATIQKETGQIDDDDEWSETLTVSPVTHATSDLSIDQNQNRLDDQNNDGHFSRDTPESKISVEVEGIENYEELDSDLSNDDRDDKSSGSEDEDDEDEDDDDKDVAVKQNTDSSKEKLDIERLFGEMTNSFDNEKEIIKLENGKSVDENRVVMETEIQFDADTAITMTILEEKENQKKIKEEKRESKSPEPERFVNDFVMKVLEDEDAEQEAKKTQRRVRFGGEVIKLRTPDSDITIEVVQSDSSSTSAQDKKGEQKDPSTDESGEEEQTTKPPQINRSHDEKNVKEINNEIRKEDKKTTEDDDKRKHRSSHIPLPVAPATRLPQDPRRRRRRTLREDELVPYDLSIPNCDGGESLTSSSEGEQQHRQGDSRAIPRDEWHRLGFVDGSVLDNILKKDDWRGRVRSLDRLALALRQPEFSHYLSTAGQKGGITLLNYLLRTLYDDRSQRVICSTLRAMRSLIQVLSLSAVLSNVPQLVPSFCRHLGGGANVAVKLEAIAAVKTLMRVVRPAPVVDILFGDKCFGSRSSKQRENSLLCLMYALMTFPSTEFNCLRLAHWIIKTAIHEPKRRVRQSILEALAVLGQFVPRSQLKVEVGDLPPAEREEAGAFSEALQARLSRKILPTVSPEGLILYAIHLPPTVTGADIEWIIRGSGSLSAGSARDRTQLDNAQRAFVSPPQSDTHSSGGSWRGQDIMAIGIGMNGVRKYNSNSFGYSTSIEEQKPVYEPVWGDSRHNPSTQSYVKKSRTRKPKPNPYVENRKAYFNQLVEKTKINRMLSAEQNSKYKQKVFDYQTYKKKLQQITQPKAGVIRPLYLKFQPDNNYGGNLPPEGFPQLNSSYSPALSTRKITNNSLQDRMNQSWSQSQNQSWSQSQNQSSPQNAMSLVKSTRRHAAIEPAENSYYGNYMSPTLIPPHVSFNNSSLPPLVANQEWRGNNWNNSNEHYHKQNETIQRIIPYEEPRQSRWSRRTEPETFNYHTKMIPSSADDRELRDHGFPHRPVMAPRQFGSPQTNETVVQGYPNHKIAPNFIEPETPTETEPPNLDEPKDIQGDGNEKVEAEDSIDTQRPPELPRSPQKPPTPLLLPSSPLSLALTPTSPLPPHLQEIRPQQLPPHLQEIHPASSTPLDIENYLALGNPDLPEVLQEESVIDTLPDRSADIEKSPPKRKITRPTMKPGRLRRGVPGKDITRLEASKSPTLYPESLPPFDRPKEGINKCLMQLENPDWEVTIQGLQSVIRLARHHPSLLTSHIHTVCVALARHIRSLRSQVARAACQAAALLFALLGRTLENDVEDLASALFSRTADTNRFLRGDCSHALDSMIENISPVRSLPAILSKGAKHQNAVVRTAACRLLVDLCSRMGADRVLLLPRDIRDGILNTGAKLLLEGSLDTRNYAKELFTVLSKDSRLPAIMSEVIPNSLMRNISKTLSKLQLKKS